MITDVPRGTLIYANGICRDVETILYCSIDTEYADIEFKDHNGDYGHYKSSYDGGEVVFPNGTKFVYGGR